MGAIALKARGETPLASRPVEKDNLPAGAKWKVDDVVIKFRNQDIAALEEKFGVAFFNNFVGLAAASAVPSKMIWEYVDIGAKKDGKPYIVPEEEQEDIPLHDLIDVVFEALCRSYRGMSSDEFIKVMYGISDDADELAPKENPTETPTTATSQT